MNDKQHRPTKAALNKLVTEDGMLTRETRIGKTPLYGFNKDQLAELITKHLNRKLRKGEQPPSPDAGGTSDAGGASNEGGSDHQPPSSNAGGPDQPPSSDAADPLHLVRRPPASDAPLTSLNGKENKKENTGADAPPLPLDVDDATPPHEAQPRQPTKRAAEVKVAFELYVEMATRCGLAVPAAPGPWAPAIGARLRETKLDGWKQMLAAVEASAFLCGDNIRSFRADLDWLVKPKNFAKVLSGKYAGSKRASSKPKPPSRWG